MLASVDVGAVYEPRIVTVVLPTVATFIVVALPYGVTEGRVFWIAFDAHTICPLFLAAFSERQTSIKIVSVARLFLIAPCSARQQR